MEAIPKDPKRANPLLRALELAVQRMAAKKLIILLLLDAIRLLLLVACGHIAGDRLAFCAGLCAFDDYVLSWHDKYFLSG